MYHALSLSNTLPSMLFSHETEDLHFLRICFFQRGNNMIFAVKKKNPSFNASHVLRIDSQSFLSLIVCVEIIYSHFNINCAMHVTVAARDRSRITRTEMTTIEHCPQKIDNTTIFSHYQLLAHLTFRLAISVSSSSLAKTSTVAIANMGEHTKRTLVAVQAYSIARSTSMVMVILLLCIVRAIVRGCFLRLGTM